MFAALYHWRLQAGCEQQFMEGWQRTSRVVRERYGSFGSRLHRVDDGTYVSYGRWNRREDRELYRANFRVDPEGFRLMQSSIDVELPTLNMVIVGNLLAEPEMPVRGLF